MTTSFKALPILVLGLAALFGAPPSRAQDVCIPPAVGVPALWGAPNWWMAGLPGWPGLDDPRWNNAFLQTVVPGEGSSTPHVTLRALRTPSDLYLSWRVNVDSQLDAIDQLWVAFSGGAEGEDVLFEVIPFNDPTSEPEAGAPFDVTAQTRAGAANWSGIAPPAWLSGADRGVRVWRENLVPADPQGNWAVQMRIPLADTLADGLTLPSIFRMRYLVLVTEAGGSGIAYYPSPDLFAAWDDVADPVDQNQSFGDVDDPMDEWTTYRLDLSPPHADCVQGISIARSDIGTVDAAATCGDSTATLSSSIVVSDGAGNPESNIFCARPLNETGSEVSMGQVDATFRIANWGTQADWNQVTDPETLWKQINTGPVIGPTIPDGARGDLHFTWTLTEAEACDFDPRPPDIDCSAFPPPSPERQRHQCMLVRLDGVPGLTFTTSAVYRNMHFVDASTFRRESEVSVVGLPPLPGSPARRDVYLYVRADNMPARVEPPDPERPRQPDCGVDHSRCIPPLEEDFYEELRKTTPTYQVHAFHDTGRTITLGGETYPLLAPQTSFGYFVNHEGELSGWRHELEGAEQIATNYYRIGVPEGGVATVTNVIEALEDGDVVKDVDHRFSISLHGGFNSVQGTLGEGVEGSLSLGADFEYPIHDAFALELFAGYDDFDTASGGDELLHLSLNLKAYSRLTERLRWFALVGLGLYEFDSGPSEEGYNLGTGVRFPVRSRLWLDATVRYHVVELDDVDFTFLTAHWGVSYRF